MTVEDISQLAMVDVPIVKSDIENVDPKVCKEVTAKDIQMCVENICWYFEQNIDDKKM
jgi:hypothetical protein